MILGLGLDVVEISRITRVWNRFGLHFAQKVLHPEELARLAELGGTKIQFLASRFAAKEATVKALGTGFSHGILPTDIAVTTLAGGGPALSLYGEAGTHLSLLGADKTHISLTHGRETVAAVVILEKYGQLPPSPSHQLPQGGRP